jgi:phosphate transport system substrate-binding protein
MIRIDRYSSASFVAELGVNVFMDLTATLTILATILAIISVFGAAVTYLLNREKEHPNYRRNRLLSALVTGLALIVILIGQYVLAPSTSILTYLPGVAFPGSNLQSCHVTVNDFPHGSGNPHSLPAFHPELSGQTVDVSGSSVLYGLVSSATSVFDARNGTVITVEKLNSDQGLQDVISGHAQIGLSDIYAQDDPLATQLNVRELQDYQIAVAPFALLVSGDVHDRIQNLTTEQIVDIFSGKVTNWRAIGGPDEPITVFNRQQGSGTRVIFEKYVLGISVPSDDLRARTTQTLIRLLARTKGGIGYAATTSLLQSGAGSVYPVCIDGFGPTVANINTGTYTFWSYEHAYVKQITPSVRALLDYICSPGFQAQDLHDAGFLAVRDLSQNAIATHAEDYPRPQICG